MDKKTILETIQRMVALSENNPNEHEAQLAAQKAQEYMLKYNIGLAEVNSYSSVEWVDFDSHESGRLTTVHDAALSVVEKFYFVKVLYSKRFVKFENGRRKTKKVVKIFGEKHNVEVANYIYHYLVKIFHSLWEDARAINGYNTNHAAGYYWGISVGLSEKLAEDRKAKFGDSKSQNALIVLSTELDKKFIERFPNLTAGVSRKFNSTAYNTGKSDSRHVNIKNGLRGYNGSLNAQQRYLG